MMQTGLTVSDRIRYGILILFLIVSAVILYRNSWIGDDAYITFRTIDNFLSGYGLRWNVVERVQTYTHPLWLFVLTGVEYFVRDIFYTAHGVSLVVSVVALVMFVFGCVPSYPAALVGLAILIMSNAFVEYASSGLENPMSYLLSVLFLWKYLSGSDSAKRVWYLSLIASLAMVNRMDTILLFFPALVYSVLNGFSYRKLLFAVAGMLPFAMWELFSMIYYGFPFPNTAYAKLGAGIPQIELAVKALQYYANSLRKDPLTLTVIAASLCVSMIFFRKRFIPLSLGILLYLLYIVNIGGGFMSGRFFSVPLLWSTVLFVSVIDRHLRRTSVFTALVAGVVALGFCSPTVTLFKHKYYGLNAKYEPLAVDKYGIEDEQLCYYQSTGLLAIRENSAPPYPLIFERRDLKKMGHVLRYKAPTTEIGYAIGILGYYAGPRVHIIDIYALADPLLARLPMKETTDWRIGHLTRVVPEGYKQTLETGENVLRDYTLWKFYDKLSLVTRGRLFDPERLKTIVYLNFGNLDRLQSYLQKYKNPLYLEHETID